MRKSHFLFFFILLSLVTFVADANAQEASASTQAPPVVQPTTTVEPPTGVNISQQLRRRGMGRPSSGQNQSIFAFPGTQCPPGSIAYKGPEAKLAAAQGISYCVFSRRVIVLPKEATNNGKCPGILKPYAGTDAQPDADVIWCEMPRNDQGVQQGKRQERGNR